MHRSVEVAVGDIKIIVLDSISQLQPDDAGHIIVCGSHGGTSAGRYALSVPIRAVFYNDAGIGKDRAGVLGIEELGRRGIISGAVGHNSAKIGLGMDSWNSGTLTFLNQPARDAELTIAQSLRPTLLAFIQRLPLEQN